VSDIKAEGRELVITKDGRVKRSPVPAGFNPQMFRHIVAGVDLLYRKQGKLPTINEVTNSWENFEPKVVRQAWATPEFKEALAIRGIEFEAKVGLTAEQLYAIQILQDPSDKRMVKARLSAIGIPMTKYTAWMRNPVFARAMTEQAEQNLGDSVNTALNRLVAAADSGESWAINKVLEMTGRWNPQQQEVQNARTVVLTVMEVIQEECADDKELLDRILNRVRGKMTALSIQNSIGQ